jgi:BlaI family transcriptional regulator, penicillinase repressor
MQLSNTEEQVMGYVWKLERAYLKNILDEFPEPKPATTTVATLLKRMTLKGFVGFEQHGSNRLYFPLVKKSDYFSMYLKNIINDFFDNSATQFASFFTSEITETELKELRDLVDKQLRKKAEKNDLNHS